MSISGSFKVCTYKDSLYVQGLAATVTSPAVDVFTSLRDLYDLSILILHSNFTLYSYR